MTDDPRPLDSPDADVAALLEDWLASAASDPAGAVAPAADDGPRAGTAGPPDGVPADPHADAPTLLDAVTADRAAAPEAGDADAPEGAEAPVPQQRLVLFASSGSAYAVRDALVTEVGRVPKITTVPRMPPWLRGVTSLRGDIVSVIDVRTFLGLEATSVYSGRLLVVRLPDEEFSAALLVDEVLQIASVPNDAVKPPASPLEGSLAPFLTGVAEIGGRLVAVLDLERLLRSAEIRQFDDRRDAEPAA